MGHRAGCLSITANFNNEYINININVYENRNVNRTKTLT